MSGLPTVSCPACNAQMSLDVLLGHQGARDAILALAYLHPGEKLVGTAVRYLALFAPAKQTMRFDRIAALLNELGELIRPARIEHQGRSWPAPMDYWLTAMEEMLANRERLRLPLTSHGYLKSIVAGMGDRANAEADRRREASARGETPVGHVAPTQITPPARNQPRGEMPADFTKVLSSMGYMKPAKKENPDV